MRDATLRLLAAEESAEKLSEARKSAERHVRGLPELGDLQRVLDAHLALATCRANLEAARGAATQAVAAEQTAQGLLASAQATHDTTVTELKHAESAHLVEGLAQSLVVGERCPVCQHIVETRPAQHAPRALATAKRAEK